MGDGRESSSWEVNGELVALGAFKVAGSRLGRRLQGVGMGKL